MPTGDAKYKPVSCQVDPDALIRRTEAGALPAAGTKHIASV